MSKKTIFTLICTADRRKDVCLADAGTKGKLIHFDDWIDVCLQCDHAEIKMSNRGEKIDDGWVAMKTFSSQKTEE